MTNNCLQFKSGLLTPEEYRIRRDVTTREELGRLEEERSNWQIHFARCQEYFWREVMFYLVFVVFIAWVVSQTWLVYTSDSYGQGFEGKEVMYSAPIVHIDPSSSSISYHKASIAKDFGINISPVKMNDTSRQLLFQIRLPYLNQSLFQDPSFDANFGEAMKQVITQVLPDEAKLTKDLIELSREGGNKLDVVAILPNMTNLSMLQRAYSSIQPGRVREAFIKNEDMQELVKDITGQLVNLEEAHPLVAKKMIHISQGIQNANQMFMVSSNEFIKEISSALEKTQEELAKDHILHTGLEKDVHHYKIELQKMQTKLHDTQQKLKHTEQKLNETKQYYDVKVAALQEQNEAMKQREADLVKEIDSLKEETLEQKKLKDELEVIVKSRQDMIEQMEGELLSSKEKYGLSMKEMQDSQKMIQSLKQEKAVLEKNLEQIQAAVAQVGQSAGLVLDKLDDDQFSQITNVLNELNNQVITLQSDLTESQKKIGNQEKKLLEQSYKLKKTNATATEQQTQIQQLTNEVSHLKTRLSTVKQNTNEKAKLIMELTNEKKRLKGELEKSVLEVDKLKEQVRDQQLLVENYRGLIKQLQKFAGEITEQYTSIFYREQKISKDIEKVEMLQKSINQSVSDLS